MRVSETAQCFPCRFGSRFGYMAFSTLFIFLETFAFAGVGQDKGEETCTAHAH